MLDYRKKIKKLENEIEMLNCKIVGVEAELKAYIVAKELVVDEHGNLSRYNGVELNKPAIEMKARIRDYKNKIDIRKESIKRLEDLIRLSACDSRFIYEPEYEFEVIIRNGFIKGIKF